MSRRVIDLTPNKVEFDDDIIGIDIGRQMFAAVSISVGDVTLKTTLSSTLQCEHCKGVIKRMFGRPKLLQIEDVDEGRWYCQRCAAILEKAGSFDETPKETLIPLKFWFSKQHATVKR
jgi:hypothetical protein